MSSQRRTLAAVLAAFLALVAAGGAVTVHLQGARSALAFELGSPRSAPAAPTTGGGVRARVDGGRGTATGPNGSASLEPVGTGTGAWQNYDHGSARTTSFGHELVKLSAGGFEQLTTVDRRQGIRTWSWNLQSLNLNPKVMPNGSVALLAGDRQSGLSIPAVAIFDRAGRDVTPAGARWSLARGANGTELRLRLDDRTLPLPYTIDPGISGVTFAGNPQSAGFTSTWTVGFTTANPANSALAAGDTITVVFNAAFAIPATPTVTLQTGFANCSGAGATVGTTVTITLANSGGTCALPKGTAATLQIAGITNPAAGSYLASTFSVATSKDPAGNPASAVVISVPSSVSAPTFTGTPQSGGARSSWAVAFNSSASGALAAGSTITVVFPNTFTVPASPTVTLTGSYTNCSAAGVGSGTTVTVTLSNSGGACTHAASSSGNLSIKFLTNPAAGAIAASNWSVATTTDATAANPSGAVTINAATSTTAPTFTGTPQTGGARSSWAVGFTSSATGALTTGDTITVVFPGTFTVPASPTITLTGSYTNCSANGVGSGTTVTVTLADNGGTCTHAGSASGALSIKFLTNPGAGAIAAANWSVKTSTDTVAVNPASAVTINAATAPSAVSFSGAPQTGGAHSTWTVGFTTSASGALAAGDTITGVFNSGFTVPATPTVTLTSGFTNCSAVATGSGQTATITLSDNAGTCAVANSAAATLKLAGLTNPAAGSLLNTTFTVNTSRDTATASPASNVVIAAATSVTGAVFSASTRAASTSANWTVDFTTSATGALAAGDTLTVAFPAGFTVPATPTITLPVGFANCTGAGAGSGTTVTITLSDNAGTCALAASAAGEVTIAGLTNPVAGTYAAAGFSIKTSTDTTAAYPSSSIDIFGAASQVVFTTQPGGGTAGTSWSTQPVLTVEDSGGRTVANYGSNVTVAIKAGTGAAGATLSGTTIVAATNGVATFSGLSIDKASTTYQLHATSGALTAADSSTFTISAAAAQTIALNGGDGQSATVNTNVATAPSVLVTDAYGNPVSGVSVTFAVTGGGGSVTGASQSTNGSGIATVGSWKLGTTAGSSNNTLSASSTGLTGSPLGFTASATPGSASTLTVTAPGSATAGTAFSVTVTALDAYGNTATGYTGTVHFTGGGTGATLPANYAFVGGDNGTHTFTNGVTLTQAGSRTVTATDTVTGTITGTSSTIAVAAAGVSSLSVTAPASATAGTAFSVTVTALDSYGNTATSYAGTVHFTGGGTGATLPSNYAFVGGDNGTHTFTNGVTLTQAGSRTVTATDTVSGSITGTSAAITVSSAGASTLSVSAPASATAGTAFSVTVTALDAYGNTATGYTGTVHFTGGGTSPTLPSNYTFVGGDNGVHTFTNGATLTQAGSRTVTATDTVTGTITGTSATIAVSPAGASTLTVIAPGSATAGTAFSVTVTALDAYGNTATGYAGTVHFTGGGTGATLPSNYTFAGGDNGTHTFTNGVTLTQAGSRTVTATDTVTGSITGTSSTIAVSPAGASTLSVAAPASATAGSAFSTTVTALDAYGNTATGYTGTVHFTGGGTSPTLPSNYTFVGGDNGTHTFTNAVMLTQSGSRTITATDTVTGSITGTSSTIAVSPAGAATLTVAAPGSATAGTAFSVTVTALDAYGNTATGYTGTVHFTGGGTSPTLPSNYTFAGGDNGTHTFTNGVTLAQAGSRTVTATDTVTGSITGTTSTIAVSPATTSTLSVTAPANATAGSAFSVTVTALDAYGNTATGYTGTVHFSGGGTSPTLPADYTFTGGDNGVHTFTNAFMLTQAGSRTVTATDTVTGSINGTSSTIAVSPAAASTLSITAPASTTAGSAFSLTVTALDAYGNTATGYTGTVHFTGGGTSPTLPANYTFVGGDNGAHTFTNAVTLTQAGTRTVTATDTVTGTITGTSSTISVSPAGAATLTVTAPASATAGNTFSVTITALDAYGNTASGYTGTVHFTGGGTGATLPSNYVFVGGDNGSHTFTNAVTLTQAGSRTVTATDTVTGTITGTSPTIAVSAASASNLSVTAPASATAGNAFSVTVTALDTYGNTATGYTGTVHFTGGGTGATLPSNYAFVGADNGTHTFTNAVILTQAGSRTVTATDTVSGSITGTSAAITVSSAGASTLSVTAPASATAGSAFSVTVTALDAYGNTATGYTGTVHFTGGGTSPTLPSNYTFVGGDNGTHTFTTAVTLTQSGNRTVTATDTVTGTITGTSSTIAVSPAGASTLSVSAPASATAGNAFSVTVTALDAYGNAATGYTGTVHFTGGGIGATLPSNYAFVGGDNGVHTFTSGVTLTQAGSRTVTATDTITGSINGTSSTIAVSPAGASTLTVTAPASATAGSAFSTTVTALDAYGNTATGYTGTVHFTGGGTSPTLPADYTFTGGDNGVHTFTNAVILTQSGSRTITATDTVTGSITGTSSTIAVSPAGASTLNVTAPASATAGTAFSTTVTALDAYGNTATGYTGTVHFTGGGTSPTLPADYTFTGGDNGTHTFTSAVILTQAGSRTVTATDTVTGSITGTSSTIAISPAGASTLTVTAPASATAGTAFSTTVTALDAYGNTATGYTGTVHFTGGGTSPTLPADYTFTGGDNGAHTFTNAFMLTQAGSRTVTATDTVTGSIAGTSSTISVSPAGAATLTVTAPSSATAGSAFSVTVTALDAYGNTATGYTGTVHFTGGGTSPTLPSDYTFVGGDNGVHTFSNAFMLTQAGSRTITATDTVTGSITGTSSTISVSPAGAATLAVTAPGGVAAGVAFSATVTAIDAYGNTATGYTGTVHFTGGGIGATLPSNYTFTGGDNGVHTFTNGVTLTLAGSRTITATDTVTGSITGTSATITVSASATQLDVTAAAGATAGSAFGVTVTAKDSFGNVAVGYTGTVHFTGGGTSATLPSDYTFTGGDNGTHTFTNGATLTQAGSRTITATDTVTGSITGTSSTIAVSSAGASTLTVTAPASATAGTAFSTTVTALDAYGNTATGYTGTVHFTGGGAGATLPSDYTFTGGDNGLHTFTNSVTLTAAGNRTLTATDTNTGSITGTSGTISVSPAGASTLSVTAPANATAGTAFSTTVTALDAFGNTATGYTGTVHFTGGGTSPTLPSDYTYTGGDNGTHTFTNAVTLTQAGNRAITATDTVSGSISGTSSSITVSAASAHTIAIQTGDGQSATVGTAVTTAPAALVTDQYGNPVAGASVTFAAATGGGNVTGASQTTNASGIATTGSWTLGTTTGANTLTATSTGLTGSPLTYTATATADVAASFALSAATTSNDVAGTADNLTITAHDQYGNVATGFGGAHTLTFAGANSIGGHQPTAADLLSVPQSFGTPTTLTFVAGTTTSALTLYRAESASITATDSADSISTASPLGIGVVNSAAHTIAIQAGDGQSATVGTAVATAPSALVTDQYGNPVAGASVAFAAATGGGNVTGGNQTTNASGIATAGSWTLGTTTGANTLTATSTGLTGSPLTYTATATPDTASTLTVTAPATATAGSAFSTTVTAKDQYGNTATGYTGTVHFTGGGAGATLPSDYTFVGGDNGTHTFTNAVTLTAAGSRTLTATDTVTGSITGTSGTIAVAPAGASTLTVSAPGSATAGNVFSVIVTAFDQYGNQATGYTGTIHFTGGGAGATLPSDYTFVGGDSGTHTFNGVALAAAGSRTLTATDTVTGSITGTSGTIAVSPAGASTLSVTSPASATAGSAFSVTVTALDAYGNTATGYTGTVHFTGGGTSPTLPSDYTFTGGDLGVHTFSNAVVLTQSGSRTLTATDTNTGSITGTSGTISVSPAGASTFTVGAPASATAGTAFSVTVTALDGYGNAATGYTGTVHFTGGGAGATLPSDYTFVAGDNGSHTFTNGVTLTQAGNRTITATDTSTGSITGTSATIAVSPAGASTLTVTAPANATAGTAFSATVTALDAYGNTATGYTGTVHFTGGGTGATLPSDYTFTGTDSGTHTFNSVTLTAAGTRTFTATDTVTGSITGTSGTITVSPAGATTLAVTAPAGATAGTAFSLTVTAKDAYGNTATGYTGTVTFSGGGTGATLPSDYTFIGGDNGTHTFANGATLTQAGNRAVTATDTVTGSITGTSSTISVSPAGASTLTVTAPASATAGTGFSVTVTAKDAYGNTATAYAGTVHFTGGGTGATLPSDYTFAGGDNGAHTFTNGVTLAQAGNRTVTATDTSTGSITGTSPTIAVSPAGASTLTVTAAGSTTAGSPFSVTVTAKDAYGNTATAYTGTVHFTGGGAGATLPSDYTFAGGDNGTHTFNGATLTAAGNRTLTATDTVTGSTTGTSGTIAVAAAGLDATVSTVGSSPGTVTADGSTTSTITVTATDAYGNAIAGAGVSLSQGTGNSTISPASTSTDGSGSAAFTVKDTTAETVTYQATVASTLLTQTANVQFVPGAADGGNTTIAAAPTSVPADGTSTSTITVHAKDAHGNALTSSGGVVTLSTDHGSLSSVTDNNDGTYTATLTASNSIETATVTGTIDGSAISAGTTVSFTGVPSKYLVTSSNYAPAANSGVTITAQLADQDDNPTGVAGKTITWSKTGPGSSFSSPTSVTNASGIATVTFTTGPSAPASYTVTATDDTTPSSLTGTSPAISTSVGGVSAADSTIGAAPSSVPADGTTTSTVTVTLTDSLGNPISGKTVTLSQPGGASSTISSASGPSDSNGHVTFTVTDLKGETVPYTATDTTDSITLTHTASVTFVDSVPPTIAPASPADGATGSGTVTFAASGVGDPGSGIASVTFFYCDSTASACAPTSGTPVTGIDGGGGNWTAALDTTGLIDGHSYSWVARAADNAGNHTDTAQRTLSVDNSTPSLTLGTPIPGTSPDSQYYDSTSQTLWLNSSDAGSFQLAANASDAQSGISDVRFSALLGTGLTNDTTSPYQSAAYNFAPGSNSGTVNITAFNGATIGTGANSTSDAFTIAADTAAPSAFALGAPADTSKIGTGVTVSAAPTDGQSGLRQVAFYYCDLGGGPCVPSIQIGLTQTVPVAGVYAVSWDTTGLTDGHSYAIDAVATDNVGHTTTSTASTVTVDNSAPAVAVAAPTALTGSAYQSYDAANKRLWLNANQTGSFKLRANASDADSGIASVIFPALLGTGTNTGALNGGVYESSTYSFNNPSAPGSKTITAANGVTNPAPETSSDSIDVEVDGSSPTTIQTFPLDNGSYQTGTWNGNCAPSGICGTVTDGGSGVAQVNVSIKDRTTGKYWGGTAFDQSTQTFNAASVAGNNWHYALDESQLTSPHAYLVEIYAVDNVGNSDVHQQFHFTFGSDTGGPSDTLSATNATHAYLTATAPYVLYYGTSAGGGGFELHASATDPSGVDTVTFPDLSGTSGFSGSGGTSTNGSSADPYTVDSPAYSFTGSATTAPAAKNVDSADIRGNVSHDQVTFVLDNTAPTGGSLSVNGGNAYSTTTSFPVSHTDYTLDAGGSGVASSVLTVASTTLSNNACGPFGSPSPVSDGPFSGSDATCYRFTLTGTDNVGNAATTTVDVKVDTTAPSQPTVTFGNLSSGNTYDDGAGTLYYRPSAGGTFRVDASSTDPESGVQSYTFSPLSGFASTNQSGGSLSATFNGASTGGGAFTVHATNNAALDSPDATYNVTADSTAPSGGSLTVNGTAATGAGSSSYLTSGGSVAVATTPYSDGGSGLASQVVAVQQASLSNDSCATYGGTIVVGGASYGVANGNCYLFTITATDNVGNVTSAQTTVKVDTTAPVAPGISFTGASAGNTFVSGSTLYYRPSAGGTFTVNATGSSDPETGIAGYTFATLSGFTGATQTGNRVDVTFDGSSAGGGAYTVVANNNAGVSSTPATAFSITKDSTAPSGGLLSINPYSGSLSVAIAKTDFTDAGSGIASNVVTRSNPRAPVAGSCPVGGYTGANAVTLPNDTVPADGQCYQYTLTGTDNVGNAGTYSTNVLVDTTGPTGGSVSYANGTSSLSAISVDWNAGTDTESGIAQVRVDRASAPVTGGACGSLSGFSTIVANATVSPVVDSAVSAGNCYAYLIVVTNNAGVSSTFTSASVTQLTTAVPFQIANTVPSGVSLQGSTLYLGPAAANQPWKLQLTTDGGNGVTQATWQGKSGSPLSSAPTTDSVPTNQPFNSGVYTWDGTPVNDTIQLTRDPGAQVDLVHVVSDLTAPTGSITYANGVYGSHSVHITTSASDADSGVASTQVQRASAPLTGATCGSWTSYSNVTLSGGGNDTTVTDNTCYSYQLVVTDNVGNQFTATSPNVAEIPDITPPTFVSAATNVAGTQLAITMSEPLDTAATTPASAFTVTYDGVAQPAPSGISVSGSTVTLDLVNAPDNSQVIRVSYAQPSSAGDRMRDLATPTENETASFGPVAVTNNTPDTVAPSVTSASVNGATLTLVFDEAPAGAAPDPSAFTVTAGATGRAVTNVAMSGNVVTLTLASAVTSADTVDVSYAVPALNALHDATGNTTTPFTRAAANQTPVVAPPVSGGGVVSPASPGLVSASPDDGATVRSVATISLGAGQAVTWTNIRVTRPDGSVAALPDAWGSTATWPFATSAPGLYVVRGTLSGGGQSVELLTHFTIWTPTGTAIAPPVEKNAGPDAAGELTSADGLTDVAWPAGTFDDEVVVDVAPHSATDFPSLPKSARVVNVTAFLRSTHAQVTNLGSVIDIRFANASLSAHPLTSEDGKTWTAMPQLQTLSLDSGQSDGWFRDSDGTVHVLARHLSYYALVGEQVSTTLALRLQTVHRLWLAHRSFIAVRFSVTMPARVTGNFVATDGTVVPGQTVKTPTRHAGVTILRIPLRVTKPGVYQLQMHAEGGGQAVDQTATITFLARKPSSPVWQAGATRVAVIRGAGELDALGSRLGEQFVVEHIADADLYRVVDPASATAAAAVVVDLSTVPMYTLAELHALLPEVQIIGLGGSSAHAAYYRSIGVSTLLRHGASAKRVATAVRDLVR